MPVILINTNKENIWVWHQVEHRAVMEKWGDNINISFQPVSPNIIRIHSEQVKVRSENTPHSDKEKPNFGPMPYTNSAQFDFITEIQ